MEEINFVLFWFMNDWGKYGFEYEHIAKYLARLDIVRQVICIFPPDKGSYVLPFTYNKLSPKLRLLTPNNRIFPLSRFGTIQLINRHISTLSLRYFVKLLGSKKNNTILWLYPPHRFIDKLILSVPHSFLITQIVDNNTFREGDEREEIAFVGQQYGKLAKSSDMIITASKLNFQIFSTLNQNCYLFENAVDEQFLSTPSSLPYITNKTRPRLGYVGWISQRTDIELLDYIAKNRSEYDLIIAGPQEENLNKYGTLDLPNVSYKGIVPYENVPKFLRTIDICLIPHKDTPYSRSMNPLKLFQYLASGRPIVSTLIAGVERWDGIISIANDYEDFLKKIDDTLKSDNKDLSYKRIAAAKLETWEIRCNNLLRTVMRNLTIKYQKKSAV